MIFIDETSTNTRLTKRAGWSPEGERYRTHVPFGSWKTQTFVAGLRCHGMVAPWIVDAPMNTARFEFYIETQLAPQLSPGDIVIRDNVAFHKSPRAAELVRERGAWMLALPAYSPDLNPSRWRSRNSRPCSESALHAPSTPSATHSRTSATSSTQSNAETSSKPQDMRPIKRDTL